MMRKYLWVLVAASVTAAAIYFSNLAFRQDSVYALKEAVRSDFRVQKGIALSDVGFVPKNGDELYGFAAFKIGLRNVVKACIANRKDGDASYVWNCY